MAKTIWQRIRKNHFLLMALCCLVPIILIVGFLSLSRGSSGNWVWLIILLCPLLHIWMMRGHKHSEPPGKEINTKSKTLYKCPECGLEYQEKEWAEKCEAWCGAHKSCNLEITAHAVKDKQDKV